MPRIALYSDWHLGMTSDKAIRKEFARMAELKPDLVVGAGDYNGGWLGAKALRTVVMRQREAMPDTPAVSVIGNHDLWCRGKPIRGSDQFNSVGMSTRRHMYPSKMMWDLNYSDIIEHFKKYNIHFLDEQGVYRNPLFPGLAILGHTMWYENPYPSSNDSTNMPVGVDGDTHAFLRKRGYDAVYAQVDSLTAADTNRIFVSHFPVIKTDTCIDFEAWSGSASFGSYLESLGVSKFLNGHAHQLHEGPLRFESGSDYHKPKFLIIDV